jgi:hypothetical protein
MGFLQDLLNFPVLGSDKLSADIPQRLQELAQRYPVLGKILNYQPDAAMQGVAGMALPSAGPYGLPIKSRLSALMESPSYFDVPLRSRIGLLKGQPEPRPPELDALMTQARNYTTTQHGMGNVVGRVEPDKGLIPTGWIQKLIQGSGRR